MSINLVELGVAKHKSLPKRQIQYVEIETNSSALTLKNKCKPKKAVLKNKQSIFLTGFINEYKLYSNMA